MRAISRLICAVLVVLGAAMTVSPVTAQDIRARLPGLWLIEAPYYDPFVDMGLDIPAFPVLAIRADGTFNLFRLRPICEPVDVIDRATDYADNPLKRAEACRAYVDATKPDGVAAHSVPAAQGKWVLGSDGRLTFAATSAVVPGASLKELIAEIRKAMSAGELDYEQRAKTGEDKAALARRMAVQSTRMVNYAGTFYVFDGTAVTAAIEGDRLILTGADPADRFVYRRITPAAMAAAANIVLVLEVAATRYFRCTVERLRAGWTDRGPPADELGTLATLANEMFPLSWALEYADALDKAGRQAEAEKIFTTEHRAAFVALIAKIRAHPAAAAAKERKLGAWLGCPERDRS